MKTYESIDSPSRRGFTMSELIVAMVIVVTTLVGATQLMYQAARQYRTLARQQLLIQEAANIMEDLMSRPWESLVAPDPPAVELSAACRHAIPTAVVRLEIVPDAAGVASEAQDMRRIRIEIDPQEKAEPTCLVAWRFRSREVTP